MTTASIVVHKSPVEELAKALQCLEDSSVDRVYIIDNSPTLELKKVVENYKKAQYRHVENNGFGAGHNLAIKQALEAGADYHLVMNSDVWWEQDVPGEIIRFMNSHPDAGLVSPKTFYPNGDLQYTCRMLPTPTDLFFKRFLPSSFKKKRMKTYLLEDFDHNHEINCPYLLGSFMFFRAEALRECGLFDERFFMYPEDIDITRRIHEKWKTIYWPGISIIHEHRQASKKNFKMFWIHFTNMVKYFNKWGWIKDNKRKIYNKQLRDFIGKSL